MSLSRPAVADAAATVVAGLTVQLLEDGDPVDVLLAIAADEGRTVCADEGAMYLAAVDLVALVVAHASSALAVDRPELLERLGQFVARQACA